ncbi:predicted protein [Postia placenta Mad-698-R]|nr:predicted protein [Postia placenta Mad-698-R]
MKKAQWAAQLWVNYIADYECFLRTAAACKQADDAAGEDARFVHERRFPQLVKAYMDHEPPSYLYQRPSAYAFQKLEKGEYVKLWYFTLEYCTTLARDEGYNISNTKVDLLDEILERLLSNSQEERMSKILFVTVHNVGTSQGIVLLHSGDLCGIRCSSTQRVLPLHSMPASIREPHDAQLDTFVIPTKPWKTRYRCKNCGVCVAGRNSQTGNCSIWGATLERTKDGKIKAWDVVKPTAHIFYGTRMVEVNDDLGKWEGFEGNPTGSVLNSGICHTAIASSRLPDLIHKVGEFPYNRMSLLNFKPSVSATELMQAINKQLCAHVNDSALSMFVVQARVYVKPSPQFLDTIIVSNDHQTFARVLLVVVGPCGNREAQSGMRKSVSGGGDALLYASRLDTEAKDTNSGSEEGTRKQWRVALAAA